MKVDDLYPYSWATPTKYLHGCSTHEKCNRFKHTIDFLALTSEPYENNHLKSSNQINENK